jgi:TRAP transporter TAXI family solute receptor
MAGRYRIKEIVSAILILVIAMAFGTRSVLAGNPENWPKSIAIASGTGTSYYAVAGGIGKMMENYLHVPGIPTKTSGGLETVRLMARGEIQMGFITPDCAYEGMLGIDRFKDIGPAPIRVFLQDFPISYNLVTLEGSGIKSFADLKGKRGFNLARGSGIMELLWQASMKIYGFKEGDLKKVMPFDRTSEWTDGLETGKIDFAIDMGTHPAAKWMELANKHPMRIIGWNSEDISKLQKLLPYVFVYKIPGGTYRGMSEDINLPAVASVIEVVKDLPDDFVYNITKMIWTHFEEFKTYHPACKLFTPEAVERNNFIYHPGAIKYYKEIGVWTKSLDKRQAELIAKATPTK